MQVNGLVRRKQRKMEGRKQKRKWIGKGNLEFSSGDSNADVSLFHSVRLYYGQELQVRVLHRKEVNLFHKDRVHHRQEVNLFHKDRVHHRQEVNLFHKDRVHHRQEVNLFHKDRVHHRQEVNLFHKDRVHHIQEVNLFHKD